MGDLIFAFFHLFLLLGAVAYALYSLLQGNVTRFAMMAACLILYYVLVLHKAVKKEIERKKKLRHEKKAR
jgi:Ca2+/Na+ antiporter